MNRLLSVLLLLLLPLTALAEGEEDALYSRVSALAWAAAGAELSAAQPADCEIADRWIEYTRDAGELYARAVYETHTDIAVTRDVLYQQGG